MAVERVLSNLNLISFKTEEGLQNHIDELQDGDLVFTPDSSLKGNLFDFKWTDHALNDMSWLNADTFSWQSGDVYVAAYEHLLNDYNSLSATGVLYAWTNTAGDETYYTKTSTPSVGDQLFDATGTPATVSNSYVNGEISVVFVYADGSITYARTDPNAMLSRDTSKDIALSTPESKTETINGITITYYQAEDGHKICLPDQEANVQALYEATGVAWYYILDTENKQFKLPRTKHAFTGLRDSVGGYVSAGLPNITGKLYPLVSNGTSVGDWATKTGVFKKSSGATAGAAAQGSTYAYRSAEFDASDSSSVYGNSNTVQPEATQMYLYFYVGNFEQSALEQTAGITSEQLNNKADISDVQALETRTDILEQGDYVVASQEPTSSNGYTWYRKYKSGWVEQGGRWTGTRSIAQGESGNVTPSLPIKMANKYYYVNAACEDIFCVLMNTNAEVHQCTFGWGAYTVGRTLSAFIWEVKGFAA